MSNKLENESGTEGILFRQGKLIGHLEDLKSSVNKLDIKVDRNYEATISGIKEVLLQCDKNINNQVKVHAENCPMIDKFNLHLVEQEEQKKHEKENEYKQDKIQSKKIAWFKWIISMILGIFGLKGVIDIIFHSSHKVSQNIDKLLK